MLVKLAFAMQRLKKYLKKCCHDQQRWGGEQFLDFMGGTAVMRRDIELIGGPHQGQPCSEALFGLKSTELYHKLKVLLMLSCNYMMQFINYDYIEIRFISFHFQIRTITQHQY